MALDLHRDFMWPFSASVFGDSPFGSSALGSRLDSSSDMMKLDLQERPEAYDMFADMPGLGEKDVKIELKNRMLTISGESKHESEEKDGDRVLRSSFSQRSFMRSVRLPQDVDEEGISASMDKGVLKLTLPRRNVEAGSRVIAVEGGKAQKLIEE
mmetsp:Transcript_1091/g.2556  ORF Transcript_1091/g.2556 Transcript_1091/m.2556 type:complete len:155 (-) Transcript_1091:282-746(-)|eukprot:jgi/Tetstr1/425273/TSEL_015725.t1